MGRQIIYPTSDPSLWVAPDSQRPALDPLPTTNPPPPPTAATAVNTPPDSYADRLIKYIPSDIVVLYVFINGVLMDKPPNEAMNWIVFLLLFGATGLYLYRVQGVRTPLQILASMIAFALWALAMPKSIVGFAWYTPAYSSVILAIYTFFLPLLGPKAPEINPGRHQP